MHKDHSSSKRVCSSMISHARFRRVAVPQSRRNATTVEDDVRKQELEQDLRLARDLQQGLMLETVPRIPGWELSAVSLPARELGGDLYDFLTFKPGLQGIMIGDVSGKGLPAALRMAVARTVFRSEARRQAEFSPGATLAAVNSVLLEEIPHGMVTMLYATINTLTGTVCLANAGHNYPVLITSQVDEVESTGLPLCVAPLDVYSEQSFELGYGQTVLLYTDGITEAVDRFDEMYGFERLQALLELVGHLKPRALMARILAEVRAWAGSHAADDITMLLVRRRLQSLVDEMKSVVADVIGPQMASDLWKRLEIVGSESHEQCVGILKQLGPIVQAEFGRGIAREIQGQLRSIIEEYRLIPSADA